MPEISRFGLKILQSIHSGSVASQLSADAYRVGKARVPASVLKNLAAHDLIALGTGVGEIKLTAPGRHYLRRVRGGGAEQA